MDSAYRVDIDPETLDQAQLELEGIVEQQEQRRIFEEEQKQQLLKQQEQLESEYEDPRNAEGGGGFKGFTKEFGSAVKGGLQDTASSIITLPERAIDMFSGEMEEESKTDEGYNAEWDDWFVDESNPIETKTWWGGAI